MSVAADPWSALADPTRRTVFARVAAGPCSVTEIARDLPVSRPAVSQHLRVLLDAHLVDVRKQGRERLYQPRPDRLAAMRRELEGYWTQTLTTFKHLAEQAYAEEGNPPS
ncbi:ArsR/SmtB family transcription factor [Tsukamurella tyrosinosolvens]|uniref:ArsR/SmtB family transcription factor n=1 Tax=Tsukamurella tyrosinosolvens TaxID=57704 RepID=UPI00187EB99E|nr:metalloregulator ArsR/SmtB family transcription factor [Tsukamurella tyrosinosolvens]